MYHVPEICASEKDLRMRCASRYALCLQRFVIEWYVTPQRRRWNCEWWEQHESVEGMARHNIEVTRFWGQSQECENWRSTGWWRVVQPGDPRKEGGGQSRQDLVLPDGRVVKELGSRAICIGKSAGMTQIAILHIL